ncbi:lantibiotic immunity ABC transporter MutG family permease subunit [Clostridium oceanicum]|uniref:Lantibiotic immunity ABC transporter MutG family permease subunit n=1 Tax=Clostridium oceanicum TaxID=1543 RepID=A0ABP3UIA9_9CLOT
MIMFFRFIKSDFIKVKRRPIIFIHFIIPIIGMIMFFQCFSYRISSPTSKIIGLFELAACVFPALTGIVCAMVSRQEYSAGGFQQMLTSHVRYMSFLSKIIVVSILGLFSSILLACGSGIIFKYLLHQSIFGFGYYLYLAGILFISNIFFYVFNFIISLKFGAIQSIVIGVIETLMSPIFTSTLFNGKWLPLPSIVLLTIVIGISCKWFSKWEGRENK